MINGKMDPEKKAKWVEALRSGQYRQGTGQLCTMPGDVHYPSDFDDGGPAYCCLGVLNQILELGCADDDAGLYSDVSRGLFGLREPILLDRVTQNKLIRLNDDEGWDFNAIASWIEENL